MLIMPRNRNRKGRSRKPRRQGLVSLRSAVIVVLALLTGVTFGVLAHLAGDGAADTAAAALGALGASLFLFDRVIG